MSSIGRHVSIRPDADSEPASEVDADSDDELKLTGRLSRSDNGRDPSDNLGRFKYVLMMGWLKLLSVLLVVRLVA